jgi:serine/threonine-protein kinase HipA
MDQCTVFVCTDPDNPYPVAKFALDENNDGHFRYGKTYLSRRGSFALDPRLLPLSPEQMLIRRHKDGTYGILSDAGPNTWGVRLTSSIYRQENRPLPATIVDWLLEASNYGSGCLGFSPSHDIPPIHPHAPLPISQLNQRLLKVIDQLASQVDTELDDEALRLVSPGTSLGGVRPKTVVLHEGNEHIAKFSRADDKFNVPMAEYATMRLAYEAKINVSDFELALVAGKPVLLVSRFDRTDTGGRIHYISAKTLINIDTLSQDQREYKARYSYAGIAESTRGISDKAVENSKEIFRRMVFNILVGNVDDHMRNHGFIMDRPDNFVLSPAFDLVPHLEAMNAPQSIGVGAYGPASTMRNALSQSGRFFLSPHEARDIIGQVREVVSNWRQVFREAGMTQTDIHTLTGCFLAADEAEKVMVPVGTPLPEDEDV